MSDPGKFLQNVLYAWILQEEWQASDHPRLQHLSVRQPLKARFGLRLIRLGQRLLSEPAAQDLNPHSA